jgi:hypothetical protein
VISFDPFDHQNGRKRDFLSKDSGMMMIGRLLAVWLAKLGSARNELRTYQAYLLRERKLTPGSVVNQVAATPRALVSGLARAVTHP